MTPVTLIDQVVVVTMALPVNTWDGTELFIVTTTVEPASTVPVIVETDWVGDVIPSMVKGETIVSTVIPTGADAGDVFPRESVAFAVML